MAVVFTHAGKAIVTNRMIGSGTEPKYVAIGTGTKARVRVQPALAGL